MQHRGSATASRDRRAVRHARAPRQVGRSTVWGVPLSRVTMDEAVAEVERLVDEGSPSYLVSANLNYAMMHADDERLRKVTRDAALVLVDGMPLVWASRRLPRPLPERVAGSDLIFELAALAERRGFRVFLLGGAPGIADAAARNLRARHPDLRVVGTEAPPYGPMAPEDEAALLDRIRDAGADILIAAFSQPRGEFWMADHHGETGAAVNIQVGAALDFAAGRVSRAPIWIRRCGLEWAFRLALEPRRLAGRYARNAAFLARQLAPARRPIFGREAAR